MKMAYKLDSVFKVLMFFKAVFPKLFQLADHKICKKKFGKLQILLNVLAYHKIASFST